MTRRLALLVLAVTVAACGSNPVDDGPTLASLEPAPTPAPTAADFLEAETIDPAEARDRAVAAYRAYLADAPDGERRREALRRLADLGLEAAAEADALGEARDGAVVPESVIALYEGLLETRPGGEAAAQVRYQLARALEYNGRREEALVVLDALIAEGDDTPYYGEALFRRAEALFSAGDFDRAERRYAQVVELGPETDFHDHALYMQGWSRFRQGRYEAAVVPFLRLYDRGTDGGALSAEELRSAEAQRLDDALRAVALAFSYEGGAPRAAAWFERHGAVPFKDRVYEALASHYLEERAWSDAAATFDAFADRNPLHARAPALRSRAIEAWSQGGFPTKVLRAKERYAEEYAIPGPYWEAREPATQPETVASLKRHTEELARHYHAAVQAGGDGADLERAVTWYRRFLEAFPQDPQTPELHFRLADLLFDAERFEAAATAYEYTAYEYGPHERAGEAAYAGLLARDRLVGDIEDPEAREVAEDRATDAALAFTLLFVEHPQAPAALARAAETLFTRGEAERALDAALTFVESWPEGDPALRRGMWRVIGHARFDLEDYAGAETAYLEVVRLDPAAERAELDERLAATIFRQAEVHRAAGELLEASADFLRVGAVVPGATIRARAEYDAAAALLELEAWGEAIPVLEAYRERWPEDEAVPEINRRLAVARLNHGDRAEAAEEFRALADAEGDTVTRREALVQAAELYEETGNVDRAIEAWSAFVERHPEPFEEAMEARAHLADLHGAEGDRRGRRSWLRELIDRQDAAGAAGTDRTRYLAAGASLELARERLEDFDAVRLVAPIRENLARKKALMEEVLEAFTRTAEYRVTDFATAATYHIGAIYQGFSRDLLDSELPPELEGEALAQYEIMLEEQAFPFEEKAIEIHEVNANRVLDGLWDDWIRQSYAALAQLVPARYAREEKSRAVLAVAD